MSYFYGRGCMWCCTVIAVFLFTFVFAPNALERVAATPYGSANIALPIPSDCAPGQAITSEGGRLRCIDLTFDVTVTSVHSAGYDSPGVINQSGAPGGGAVTKCPVGYTLSGCSCNMNRGGDGREVNSRTCRPYGDDGCGCSEGNTGSCTVYAVCHRMK